jgi:hypothetical protein
MAQMMRNDRRILRVTQILKCLRQLILESTKYLAGFCLMNIAACFLRAGIVKPAETAVARERLCEHIHCLATGTIYRSRAESASHNTKATEKMFSTRPVPSQV